MRDPATTRFHGDDSTDICTFQGEVPSFGLQAAVIGQRTLISDTVLRTHSCDDGLRSSPLLLQTHGAEGPVLVEIVVSTPRSRGRVD